MTELNFQISILLIPLGLLLAGVLSHSKKSSPANTSRNPTLFLTIPFIGLLSSSIFQFMGNNFASEWIQFDSIRALLLSLILFLSFILVKFSHTYLRTDLNRSTFFKYTFFTLSSVVVFILSNHILLLWLSWLFISINLHHLLLYYPERPRAQLAAHKKFLFARVAEVLLLTAALLLFQQHQTFNLTKILGHYQNGLSFDLIDHLAATFIALAAIIKCAQFPFHGWLIQVVEAPTPVSALLHAGVINLGGVLLFIFSPLFLQSQFALWLILIIASVTTVSAALIMKIRVSYKVNLAWSTSAQMGLMLIECALGAWDIFLLHLLSHSLYKAYAFLNSGEAVKQSVLNKQHSLVLPSLSTSLLGLILTATLFYLVNSFYNYQGPMSLMLLFGLGITLWISQILAHNFLSQLPKALLSALFLIGFYIGFKEFIHLFTNQLNTPLPVGYFSLDLFFGIATLSLFILDRFLNSKALPQLQASINRWLYSGFYVDEFFTALTFKIWPVRIKVDTESSLPSSIDSTQPSFAKES